MAKAEVEKKAAAAAAAAAAATAAKAAVAEAAAKALAVKKRKREEEKAYFRSWLAPRSASAGVKIYSIFDDNCICEPVRGLSLCEPLARCLSELRVGNCESIWYL